MTVTLASKVGLITSPLQSDIDLNNKAIYQTQYDNGSSGAAITIDYSANGNAQEVALTNNCTFTFTDPPGACHLTFLMVQDGIGGHAVTWPATVLWQSATEPTWTTGASDKNIAFFYFDGAQYNASGLVDVS